MIATITDIDVHRTQREALAAPAARVMLKSPDAPPGLLDGAWWPRSRDLLRELPALIAVLDDALGSRITRIAVNPEHWPVIPRKIPVAGHVVKAGWFKEQDPHKLLLLSYSAGRYDLLVIPPHTSADAAARLMAAATDAAGRPLTASALIARGGSPARQHGGRPGTGSRRVEGVRGRRHFDAHRRAGPAQPPPGRDVITMTTALTIAVTLILIVLATYVIHRLNAQHADRIAVHHYSPLEPGGRGGPAAARNRVPAGSTPPPSRPDATSARAVADASARGAASARNTAVDP